jgi:hypothetical protein
MLVRDVQISPFKAANSDEKYVEEILITAGDDVNQVTRDSLHAFWSYIQADICNFLSIF